MIEKVTVFDSQSGEFKMFRDVFEADEAAVLIFVKGEKKLAVAVIDFSGKIELMTDKIGGFREVFENKKVEEDESSRENSDKSSFEKREVR